MPQATTPEGLTLEYATTGSASDPALLLVNGLGSQLISWPDELCERLAAAGRFVVRFDNRDSGLSSKLDGAVADVDAIAAAVSRGDLEGARALAPYRLSALAGDAVALLDALGIERAHAVGSSMGGAVVQRLAIEHPERLHTLTSIMSTTGEPEYGRSSPEARAALIAPSPRDRAGYVEASRKALVWASKRYADLDAIRDYAARAYDRGFSPEGSARQLTRLIRNLVQNAHRHARSTVEIRVRPGRLEVHDDGPGVPAAHRQRIFEPFTRLDDARARDDGGTGLGLAIVRDIALAHGFTVAVDESHLGGAVFIVSWT